MDLESRIARLVASQRRIDSINKDPRTSVYEFDEINRPPLRFTTLTGHGYEIEHNCGDCASTSVLFAKPGYIATVSLGGDDDVGDLGRHLCEMVVIAKTFVWR